MVSLKVNAIVSPVSALPVVPPETFVVWMSEAAGAVLSTVTEKPLCVPLLPALSAEVIAKEYDLPPAGCPR